MDHSGKVVAVAWSGRSKPDLSQILGPTYFARLADPSAKRIGGRQVMVLHSSDLVIESTGSMRRGFIGHAYLTSAISASVTSDQFQVESPMSLIARFSVIAAIAFSLASCGGGGGGGSSTPLTTTTTTTTTKPVTPTPPVVTTPTSTNAPSVSLASQSGINVARGQRQWGHEHGISQPDPGLGHGLFVD